MMRRLGLLALAALLSSCGGASGSGAVSPPGGPPDGTQSIDIRLTVPTPAKATAMGVRPKFISPSANSIAISVVQTATHAHAAQDFDISAGSPSCTGSSAPRTCNLTMVVPIGPDAFSVKTYDLAPVAGSIPAGAHVLGTGASAQPVVAGVTTGVSLYVSGLIAAIGATPTFASLPADGASHTSTFAVVPTDFDDNPIVAGANDPYANPIHAALSESGGSGHAVIIFNGGASGQTAILRASNDTLALRYDGGGAAGYFASIVLSAAGAPPERLDVSPLFVTSASKLFANRVLSLHGPRTLAVLDVTEANAPAATAYTFTPAGCTNVASIAQATGAGPAASFTVTGGTTVSTAGCTIAVSDGTSTLSISVTNTVNGG